MCRRVRLKISGGNGVFVVISTVWGSMTRAPSVGPRYALIELPLLASRVSTVNLTSSALRGSPWIDTSIRSVVIRHGCITGHRTSTRRSRIDDVHLGTFYWPNAIPAISVAEEVFEQSNPTGGRSAGRRAARG